MLVRQPMSEEQLGICCNKSTDKIKKTGQFVFSFNKRSTNELEESNKQERDRKK